MSRAGSARLGATHDLVLDALYDRKRDNKSVRVLTVIIYVFCVSLAAIMLSLYYVFFWEPKDTQRKVAHSVDRQTTTTTTPMPTCLLPHTGRGNSSVNDTLQQLATTIGDSLKNASARLLSTSTLPPPTAALTNDTLGYTDAYNTTSDVISPLNDTNVT